MTIPTGILLLVLSLGVFLLQNKLAKGYSIILLLSAIFYNLLVTPNQIKFDFIGFNIDLFKYNDFSYLISFAFLIFGLLSLIFVWSKKKDKYFYIFAIWQIGAAVSILSVNDFLSYFVFWEIITLSSVLLLLKDGYLDQAKYYFTFHIAGTVLLLIGIGINYSQTGTMTLEIMSGYTFFLLAIMIKGAALPFHLWLISVYPEVDLKTTVILSAYTSKVGIFSLYLLLPNLDLQVVGGLIAVIGVLYALKQHRMSRLLSFHLVSQMGYVIAGIGSQYSIGQLGGVYHLINNIFYKGLLFMVAAVLVEEFDTDDLMIIKGRGRLKPLLFIITIVASASIAGVPFFNGYISKLLIKKGLSNSVAGYLLMLAGIGTALSFIKVLYYGFITKIEDKEISKKLSGKHIIPMIILSSLCIILGIYPEVILSFFQVKLKAFGSHYLWKGVWPILTALLLFKVMYERLNKFIITITPEIELKKYILPPLERSLKKLRLAHSGNLQHYLIWILSTLVFLWGYMLIQLR